MWRWLNFFKNKTEETDSSTEGWQDDESDGRSKRKAGFFDEFCKEIVLTELLKAATKARNGIACKVNGNTRGSFNVIIFLLFDDGVEWVAKLPKYLLYEVYDSIAKLESEYATLDFLQKYTTVPSPKVYGSSFDRDNAVKWPYIFMEKMKGVSLFKAMSNGLDKQGVHNTLRQLANVRKELSQHPFWEIGSLAIREHETFPYFVQSHISMDQHDVYWNRYKSWSGPYSSAMSYYINLHQTTWRQVENQSIIPEGMLKRWNIQTYVASLIPSFVGEDIGMYYLAHVDLDGQNIMVDEDGSITGIIDWEFASTLPFRDAQHYPRLLSNSNTFEKLFESVYHDPLAELQEMRRFYATQFAGNSEMERYIDDIEEIRAFQSILKDERYSTVDYLVSRKLLASPSALDQVSGPFPWKNGLQPPSH